VGEPQKLELGEIQETFRRTDVALEEIRMALRQLAQGAARIIVRKNAGADLGPRPRLNLVEGSNISLTASDDATDNEIDVTISTGPGGDSISVNGAAVADADFDDATPAAPVNALNLAWQKDASTPTNISVNLPYGSPLTAVAGRLDFDETVTLGNNARVLVRKNSGGANIGPRRRLNLIEGANVTITAADDAGNEEVDITIAAATGSTSPLTTKGDLYGRSSVDARVPVGANGLPLVADSAQTLGLGYAILGIGGGGTGQSTKTPAFNALSPQSTKGDLVTFDGANGVRKAVGSNGTVLTADSAQADGVAWTPPSGLALGATFVPKAADQSSTSTALADVTDLAFAMAANTTYAFEFFIVYQTAAVTTGIALAVNGPASPTAFNIFSEIMTGRAAGTDQVESSHIFAYNTPHTTTGTAETGGQLARLRGVIRNGPNAGTFTLRFATEVAASQVDIFGPRSHVWWKQLEADAQDRHVYKSADQASTVTALADVTDLQWAILASAVYEFEIFLAFQTAAGTTGINLSMNGPASPTDVHWMTEVMVTGVQSTDGVETKAHNAYDDAHLTANIDAANTNRSAVIRGYLRNGANAGTLTLRLATEVAASAATIKQGSWGRLRRIA
jgi:hypothetical protein